VHTFFHAVRAFFEHLAAVNFDALAFACAFQVARLLVRTRAWRNIIAAAYPGTPVRWRHVLGGYVAGVGLNAITPVRGGDVLKLYLVKHRVEGSTYPTLGATLVVETLFDAVVGIALLVWAAHLGVLPSLDRLPDLPSVDWGWPLRHPRVAEVLALVLGIVIGVLLVVATRRVQAFWRRVGQGFAIVRSPSRYLTGVVTWQALSWGCRLGSVYWMLRAFNLPASVHNALLVQIAQSLSTVLPITPGGAGTEQGLLLFLFRGKAGRTELLSFSVGMHIAIVVVNVTLGVLAVALMTRSLRFRRLEKEALRDPEDPEVGDGVTGMPAP
jgi:glycosyltransferase 2 family protein